MGKLVYLYIPEDASVQAVTSHLSAPKNGGHIVVHLPVSLEDSMRIIQEKRPVAVVVWVEGDPVPIVVRLSASCRAPIVVMTHKEPTEVDLLRIKVAGAAEAFYSGEKARENLARFLSQV